jgi:hypothetical protein
LIFISFLFSGTKVLQNLHTHKYFNIFAKKITLSIGLGLLSAFLVEMKLFKKYGPDKSEEDNQ